MEENDKLKALHESLINANYELPDYATFEKTLTDSVKSKELYDALIKDNYELPDYDTFVNDLGLKKKDISKELGFGGDILGKVFGDTISEKDVDFSKFETPDISLQTPDSKGYPQTDINTVLAEAIANPKDYRKKPEKITFENYLTALPQAFNLRMGEAIRNIGEIINLPKTALKQGVEKISKKKGDINSEFIEQAFSSVPILGTLNKENINELATVVENAGNPKSIPNNIIGKTLSATGSIMFDLASIRIPTVSKLNILGKYGMERVPMFPAYLATMGGTTAAREGKGLKGTTKAVGEGIAAGLTYEGMGVTAGRIGQLVKELGGTQGLSTASKALANGVMFGADSKIKGGTFAEGAAMGLVFGGYDIGMDAINKSIAHRAYVSYLTATNNAIKTVSKLGIDPVDMRKQSDELWLKYEKETDPEKKKEILGDKTVIDNIININAITHEIIKDPKAFIDQIQKDERLSPKEKQLWTDKINTTVKENDPRLAEAQPIIDDLKKKESELEYWKEDQVNDPMLKESKIESVTTQIEEQKKELSNTLSKPLEDYVPEKKPEEQVKPEEQLTIEGKTFADKNELFKYLDENATTPEGKIKEGWMPDKEVPNTATLTAINEWEAGKKQEPKLKNTYIEETPEEKTARINDRLADLKDEYNEIPKSYVKKRAAVMRAIQGLLPQVGYQMEVTEGKIKILNTKGSKVTRTKTKAENQKLEDIRDPEQKKFVTALLNAREHLYGLDFPMGPKGIDQAVDDILTGKTNQNTQHILNGLDEMYRYGAMKFKKGENQPDIEITRDELTKQIADEQFKSFYEKNGGFGLDQLDKAVEEGLIDKNDLELYKNHFENENRERIKAEEEWAAEEANLGVGSAELPKGEEGGGANEIGKPKEIKNEEPINKPNPPVSKGEENKLPGSTEKGAEPITPESKGKPIRTTDAVKQKQIDAIAKDYDTQIAEKQAELDAIPDQIDKAVKKANERNGLFGDTTPVSPDEIIKREEQGFNVSLDAVRKPFEERQAQLTKEIDALNKEKESKIGEVLKQQTLGFEEPKKEIKATKEGIQYGGKTYTDIEQVQDDFADGKLSLDEQRDLLEQVRRYENKKNGVEPLTDAPEELAWDEPLPLSPAEDPNFKNSDLNNAMSLRTVARNFIKNLGFEEGADVRVGFIKRFARKARGIFNPTSGIIRVRNIRDLRALTHEFGHLLDYEIFDIRGIISAKGSDKNLGSGVDFNGEIYSDVAQVEKAMKGHRITIDEGNYLLGKVKEYEEKKLGEKYSEIVEKSAIIPVRYKNKNYKSIKEINDALAKGVMPTSKASELTIKFNDKNRNYAKNIDLLRQKYGSDVVDGVLQRNILKKEFDTLLKDVGYPSNKRTEGIAEFVYNYIIDPKQLINSTPNALAWFEKMLDNAPEIKNALQKIREQFADYDAQDIRTKMVAEIVPPEPEKRSWLDTIVKLGKEPMYSAVNMLRPLEVMVNKWKDMMDNNTLAYKDPWISAKQLLGQGGRSEQWILYHPYFNRKNDIVIRNDIKGLIPIINSIVGTPDYLPYQTYLVALDAIESHNRGKPEQAYFDKETALAGKAAFEKQYGAAKLMEFQGDIQKYNEALLDFAAESGRISKETAEYWKKEHQNYVPLRRIAETYEIMKGKNKLVSRELLPESERAIFSRKGSQKQIRDIFESMIENTNHILASSERNILNKNLADMFFDIHNYNRIHKTGGAVIEEIDSRGMDAYQDPTTGEIRYAISKHRPSNFKPPKGRILVTYEEGVPRFYDVAPEYYDDIFRVTNQAAREVSKVMRILSKPTHWLQAGAVVYDPTFPVRNIVRDQISTWFTSKHGYLPTDFIRGIASAIGKDEYYQKWLASGGDQSFLVSADQAMKEDFINQKVGKFAKRKFDTYKRNPLLALQDFSKASEIGTRLGAFKNAYKRTGNVKLAAIESRDITADYGIHGAITKQAFSLYPFLNARIQWARTMAESMKNPASFMLKGMALTVPAAINWLINNQDEESQKLYQSLPTWRRVGLFNIRIPGTDHFLPLPKGFYGVLFASSIESMLDHVAKDDPRVLKDLPGQLFQEISPISNWPEIIPFIGRPVVEMWANKKGYTGKPIVSESMKLLKPSEQFYNSTPEVIKKLGEALNWSPVKIEHYFKSYTGGAGIGAVNILDETLQAMGLVDKKPEDTFTTLSRMPIFKALLTERPIGLQSGYISDFYETLDKIEKVNVTFNNYVKTENYDGLDKFMSDPENQRMYSFYEGNSTALNSFRNVLTWVRDAGYATMKDPLLTNEEKQDNIRKMNDIVQESALKFKEAYEKREFFDYGKTMDELIKKMKEEKKDYGKELTQQQNTYNPYWMQLREQNKDVFDRLREFGGLKDIPQTRVFNRGMEKIDLELEDVRRFNEIVVKRYGENVKNMIGTDKSKYESYQKTSNPMDPEQTQLQQLLDSAWEMAMTQTKADFQPQYQK